MTPGAINTEVSQAGSGGGGGGAVTEADGANIALGTTTDTANPSVTATPATVIGLLKQLNALLTELINDTVQEQTDIANTAGHTNTTVQILSSVLNAANTALVVQGIGANGAPVPVSGTVAVSNLPATQPVTDAAAETSLISVDSKTPALGQVLKLASVPVSRASDDDTIYERIMRRSVDIAAYAAQDHAVLLTATRGVERISTFDRRGRYDRGSVR